MGNIPKGLSLEYDPSSDKMLLKPDLSTSEPVILAPPDIESQAKVKLEVPTNNVNNYNAQK